MVRQSIFAAQLLLSILTGILTVQTANAQCPSSLELRRYLEEIGGKNNPQQITLLNKLVSELQQCKCVDSSYALVLHTLGRALYIEENYQTAAKKFRESIAINQQHKRNSNPIGQIKSYFYLGAIHQLLQDSPKAIICFTACVRLGKLYNTQYQAIGHGLRNLSFLYQEKGDYQQALTMAEQGIYYARQYTDKILEARCLYEAARDLMLIGRKQEALSAINKAIELIQNDDTAIDNRISFTILKAQIAQNIGQPDLAVSLYQQILIHYQHKQQDEQIANIYNSLGYLYMDTFKNYGKAIVYFKLAYNAFSNSYEKARVLNNIGASYSYTGQTLKALTTYQQAFLILPINFHQADIRQSPPVSAMRLSANKEYLLTLIQDKADTWLDYAKASNNRQRFQYALDTYKVADQMIDIMRWEHTGQQSKLFWRDKTRGLYERAIETCYRLNDAEQAFRFMEKSRAVMLADKLNELGARQQLAPKQVTEEQHLRQRVSDQQTKLAGLSPDSARYAPTRMTLLASQDSLDGFLKQLEASNPAYYRYKYDNATPSLSELKEYLKNQQSSLVTYFVGDSALYVMAVTSNTATLKKLPINVYNQTLNEFAPLLADAEAMRKTTDVNRFLALSNSLYGQLLAPLALPKGRVVVSPDGFFVPFDVLSQSPSQPQYAVNDYAFSYIYSAGLLLKNKNRQYQRPGFQTRDFLGVAPVDFAPSLKQVILPNSDAALKPIAERFASPMLLMHEAATRREFLAQAAKARIIHLFTHAVADSTEQEPKLYFADSTLQLSDLTNSSMPNAQLVVLAACKTGVGANQRGEGVFSLARGFAALGVPSVLTTLWSVQTAATYQLTDLFYSYLDQGLPKDIALQRAKQDWLKTVDGASQLPNYWAGLVVVGDTEPLARTNYGLWIAALALVLVGGVGGRWYWQKRQHQARPTVSVDHSM